ncbi:toprim domain-containing protein [Cytobacillus massiliigabonensis]|uniref:toprim domain-containing protein n=1 Tax=Cytobacillus massiliigabonensis TaxID=1871011 RepID=UPI000C85A6D9|nr:toprim domain-containing protein [Cytobacillus massiliigabonensis]
MATIHIRNQPVEIDVEAELREFNWTRPRWTSDKLLAASPFRYDQTPSFFVRLEPYGDYPAGTWSDSGAYDSEWASGGLVKLLSFLRNETYGETEEYLLNAYGYSQDSTDIKLISPRLKVQRARQPLAEAELNGFTADYIYLESRGISAEVQAEAGVLYDAKSRAAVIPWRDANGRLRSVKFRTVYGKLFWYHRGATPIRELVFGIELAKHKTAILCEAEIDAMSWRQAGYAAIAIGGASFSEVQADIIKRSTIEELVIATDNDNAGVKLRKQVEELLTGYVRIRQAYIDAEFKDANEALCKRGVGALQSAFEKSESVGGLKVKIR